MKIIINFSSILKISHDRIASFYKKNWINKTILIDRKFFIWEYLKNDKKKYNNRSIIAYDKKSKKILGIYSFQTQILNLKKKKITISCGSTFNVSQEARGLGIGRRILKFAKKKSSIVYAINVTNSVIPLYKKEKFKILKAFPRFTKYIDLSKNIKSNKFNFFIKELSFKDKNIINSIKRNKLDNANFIERDFNYFNWRYFQHPYFKYKVFCISSNEKFKDGVIVVLRLEKKYNFLRIIDFFGSKKNYNSALNFVIHFAKKSKSTKIDFFSLNKNLNKFFEKNKWKQISKIQNIKLPYLYQPLHYRGVNSPPFAIWINKKYTSLININQLHFTKSEGDFDRPTFHTLKNNLQI